MASSDFRAGLRLLKRPNFAKGFFAYLVSYSGTAMAPIAMAFGVLELTGSTAKSSFVIAAPVTAQIALLLLSGTLADRTSRQKMLVGSDILAMLAQLAIAFLFLSGLATVPLLTFFMLVLGSAVALNVPAATGFIPQLVEEEELQAANALLGLARNSAITVGAALAGIMVAVFGAGLTLLIDGLSFGLSAILIYNIKPKAQEKTETASFFADLKLGWKEFVRNQWVWVIVLQFSLVVAALEAVFGLLGPAVARQSLGGAVTWGIVSAAIGLGTGVGGLIAMQIRIQRPMLFGSVCVLLFALVPIALSFPLAVWLICLAAFVNGVAGQIFGVLWYTSLQKAVPRNALSRVSAYDHLGSIALAPLGIVAGGLLFEAIGAGPTLWIAALTIILPTLVVLTVPSVRQFRTDSLPVRNGTDS